MSKVLEQIQNATRSEEKYALPPLCEMCEKHCRHYVLDTWGDPGEGPGTLFFTFAAGRALGKVLQDTWTDLFRFRDLWGSISGHCLGGLLICFSRGGPKSQTYAKI